MKHLLSSRSEILLEKILIINGQPGCGKTLISSIASSLNRVEIMNYSTELENIVRLNFLEKITNDAASTLLRCCLDELIYNNMMSRNVNFRYKDLSSVFRNPNKIKYFKRLFQAGDHLIPDKIKNQKPILHIATHNLLEYSKILFSTFREKLFFIEVIRHPLYMIKQQTLNFDNLKKNKRKFFYIYLKKKNYEFGIDDPRIYNKFNLKMNAPSIDLAIYSMKLYFDFFLKLNDTKLKKNNVLVLPFEKFVISPFKYLNKIEKSLSTTKSKNTSKVLKRENVPRNKFSDGINLDIYKKMGWVKPLKGFTEREELNSRLQWSKNRNLSTKSLKLLEKLSSDYEKRFMKNLI